DPVDDVEEGGFESGFWESCLMVSPPCTEGPDVEPPGGALGGPLLTSTFPLSSGSSGTLMVSPPTLSDIAGNYSPPAPPPARPKPYRASAATPFRAPRSSAPDRAGPAMTMRTPS